MRDKKKKRVFFEKVMTRIFLKTFFQSQKKKNIIIINKTRALFDENFDVLKYFQNMLNGYLNVFCIFARQIMRFDV